MEIENRIGQRIERWILLLSILLFNCACRHSECEHLSFPPVYSSKYPLITLTPEFTVQTIGATLHKQYPQLSTGKAFPMIGILRVDGKSYRFMGGDSLRILPLAPLSGDSCGWQGKCSYYNPGANWEQEEYDDSQWLDGTGAFGSEDHYYPIHSAWGATDIYVRRHCIIENPDALREHKLYIRYIYDDQIKLYCNGECLFQADRYIYQTESRQLTGKVAGLLKQGDNILAASGHNKGGLALLDYGLYVEDKTYSKSDTATLKRMDVQVAQTHYVFQCGDVELQLDFVSPSLLDEEGVAGCPVSFITYRVLSKKREKPDVEILFDLDTEWMTDSLYLDMRAEESSHSCKNGHVVYSQKLCGGKQDHGILLLGYKEKRALQYQGECLFPSWNKDGNKTIKDVLKSVGDRYRALKQKCDEMDLICFKKALEVGGKQYAEQMLLSYQSFMGKHRFVMASDNKVQCFGDTLGSVKEAYKYFPTLLFFGRTDWMKGLLSPVFETCENSNWVKKYPPCDMGLYPIANRQVSEEDYAVEVTADMLMMTLAIVKAENSFNYAEKHWETLSLWAGYLDERWKKQQLPDAGLLNEEDECVKGALGLVAYKELVEFRKEHE